MTTEPSAVLRWALVVLTVFVLQVGVFSDLRLFGVHPDTMLLLAICAGLSVGAVRGAEVGFAAGLLSDLLLQGPLGTTALSFALVGFAVGMAGDAVLRSSRLISVGITVVSSAAGVLLYAALAQLLGQRTLADPRLWVIVAIVSLFNALLCLPGLGVCRWAEGGDLRAGLR